MISRNNFFVLFTTFLLPKVDQSARSWSLHSVVPTSLLRKKQNSLTRLAQTAVFTIVVRVVALTAEPSSGLRDCAGRLIFRGNPVIARH